jgi:hypothetical protein
LVFISILFYIDWLISQAFFITFLGSGYESKKAKGDCDSLNSSMYLDESFPLFPDLGNEVDLNTEIR